MKNTQVIKNLKIESIERAGHSYLGNPIFDVVLVNQLGDEIYCKTKKDHFSNFRSLSGWHLYSATLEYSDSECVLAEFEIDKTYPYFKQFEKLGEDEIGMMSYLVNVPYFTHEVSEEDEELFNHDGCFEIKCIVTLAGGGPVCFMAIGKGAVKIFYSERDYTNQLVTYKVNNFINSFVYDLL